MARPLKTTDPRHRAKAQPGKLDSVALRFLNDPRDLPVFHLCLVASAVMIPFAALLYVPGVLTWWLALIYLAVNGLVFMDRFILMLHNTSHRPLFKRRFSRLNHYIPWVLGPFFGETPDTYYAHHIGMHHPENNLEDDLSSTMTCRRDSIVDFLRYFLRFFVWIVPELARYHYRRRRKKLLRRLLVGELTFYALVAGLMWIDWQATLVVFVAPFLIARFVMMAGNWGQHAFIDPKDPGNCYRNSITCIDCRYNHRGFNDGYHISHHLRPFRHWTEHPDELQQHVADYAREGAILFRGIDFVGVWALLMLKRYDRLVRHFVELEDNPRSPDEIEVLLRSRTRPIPPRVYTPIVAGGRQ